MVRGNLETISPKCSKEFKLFRNEMSRVTYEIRYELKMIKNILAEHTLILIRIQNLNDYCRQMYETDKAGYISITTIENNK